MNDVQTGLFTMHLEEQRYGNKWQGKLENRLQGPGQLLALEDHPRFYVGVQVTSLAGHPEETWTAKQDFQGSKWRNLLQPSQRVVPSRAMFHTLLLFAFSVNHTL